MTMSYDILELNKALYIKMKELALDQEQLIATNHVKEFLNRISQRERLRNEIQKNTMKWSSLMKNTPNRPDAKKIDQVSQEIATVIQAILDIDQRIEGRVSEKKELLLSEIKGFRQGQKALKGYGGHPAKKSKYVSRTG
jgi:hypothetical protein